MLVALPDDASRESCRRIAALLRGRDVPTEVAPEPTKYGKQIRFAERRGIPYVWFPQPDGSHQVRDIRSGEQVDADPHFDVELDRFRRRNSRYQPWGHLTYTYPRRLREAVSRSRSGS